MLFRGDFDGADSEAVVKFTKDVQLRVVLMRFFLRWQYNLIKTSSKGAFEGADFKPVVKVKFCILPRRVGKLVRSM